MVFILNHILYSILFSLYGQQIKGGFGMSQMNSSVDNSMRNHNPWLTSNSVGIQTWLNGPQIPVVSNFMKYIFGFFIITSVRNIYFKNKHIIIFTKQQSIQIKKKKL